VSLLLAVAVAAIAVAMASLVLVSNRCLQTTTYQVGSARLPSAFDGYRIVQISDLHERRFGPQQSRLMQAIREARPDLIVVTGDIINARWTRARNSLELARQLAVVAPTYFVTGNHEIYSRGADTLVGFLENLGVQVLRGRSVLIEREGRSLALAGIDDPDAFGRWRVPEAASVGRWRAVLGELRRGIPPQLYTVLLSHRPELLADYARQGFDLVLAGHAHGGQVRLPFIGALWVPDQGLRPCYTEGAYAASGTTMVVSRGLGSTWPSFRFLNRPELVVVKLRTADYAD
jgi:predicted MPP superfamily phosphohydrolase